MATGTPYVSAGLVGRNNKQPVTVLAVPTFDEHGRASGVLVGAILLKTVGESKQALDLGYGNLQILDRNGTRLLDGLKPVENRSLLARIQREGSGVLPAEQGPRRSRLGRPRICHLEGVGLGNGDRSPTRDGLRASASRAHPRARSPSSSASCS